MSTDVTATETTAPGTETPAADPVVDTTPETPAGDTKPAKETKAAKAKKPARPRKPRATPYTPPMPRWFLRRSLTHNYLILHKADPRRQGCIVHVNDVRGLSSKSRRKGTAVR